MVAHESLMADELAEIADVRVVSIIWAEDAEPEVEFNGCSVFEAIGLLRCALRNLEDDTCMGVDEEDD